jgi:hypothetical protein
MVLGWFSAVMLALLGTAFLFATTVDSHATGIAARSFSLPSSGGVSAGGGSIVFVTSGGTHAEHPVMGAALVVGALVVAILTLRQARPGHGVADA